MCKRSYSLTFCQSHDVIWLEKANSRIDSTFGEKRGKNQTGTCSYSRRSFKGTSSKLSPLSLVVAISASTPCSRNALTIAKTAWLGPPRTGATEGMTWRTFMLKSPATNIAECSDSNDDTRALRGCFCCRQCQGDNRAILLPSIF